MREASKAGKCCGKLHGVVLSFQQKRRGTSLLSPPFSLLLYLHECSTRKEFEKGERRSKVLFKDDL